MFNFHTEIAYRFEKVNGNALTAKKKKKKNAIMKNFSVMQTDLSHDATPQFLTTAVLAYISCFNWG